MGRGIDDVLGDHLPLNTLDEIRLETQRMIAALDGQAGSLQWSRECTVRLTDKINMMTAACVHQTVYDTMNKPIVKNTRCTSCPLVTVESFFH